MKIILASNNKDKLSEIKNMLDPLRFEIISQSEAGIDFEADETGRTFEENARIKARAVYDALNAPVIADDSGLETDYLNGEPGIYSARYAPEGERRKTLLSKLEGVPYEKRSARFVCCICYIDGGGRETVFRGTCEGHIGFEIRGEGGFGYDSVFMYGDKTFAEISSEEKNKISHRAGALKKLKEFLSGTGERGL